MNFDMLRELTMEGIIFRMILTIIVGGIIGLERGYKNQPVGSRTYMLVSLGACLVMMTNQYIFVQFNTGDISRLGAQVVSGVGFLGAGSILVTRNNQIRGLTTAAGLWSSACIGLAIGIGFFEGAIVVGVALLIIMSGFKKIDSFVQVHSKYMRVYMSFHSTNSMNQFIEYCREKDIRIIDMDLSRVKGISKSEVGAFITIKYPQKCRHSEIVSRFMSCQGVNFIEEI